MVNSEVIQSANEVLKIFLTLAPILTISTKLFNGAQFLSLIKKRNAYFKDNSKLVVFAEGKGVAIVKEISGRISQLKALDHDAEGGEVHFTVRGKQEPEVISVNPNSPIAYSSDGTVRVKYFPRIDTRAKKAVW